VKIQICRAHIVTEEGKTKLTKAVAKQFPILPGNSRAARLEAGKEVEAPLCKVLGATLGDPNHWLYLIPFALTGYAWVQVNDTLPRYAESIIERGGQVDRPVEVPMVIL
jgi:hypothetical protein